MYTTTFGRTRFEMRDENQLPKPEEQIERLRLRIAELEREISRRKKDAESLRRSERKFRSLIDNVQDLVWIADPEGRLLYVSRAVERILGVSPEEAVGMTNTRYFTPESIDKTSQWIREALRASPPTDAYEGEVACYHAGGQVIPCEVNVTIVRDARGRIVGYEGVLRDISRRKRAEASLRESEEKYRSLVENLNDIVYTTDERGVITYVTPNVEGIGGYRQQEILGKDFRDLVHPEDRDLRTEKVLQLARGERVSSEYRMLTREGQTRWVLTRAQPVMLDGCLTGIRGILVDITDRKAAEEELRRHRDRLQELVEERTVELRQANEMLRKEIEERILVEDEIRKLNEELEARVRQRTAEVERAYKRLQHLDKMKDAFLSTVSHELRTPLTSIQSFSEILIHYDQEDTETRREFLQIINNESRRLTRLINDVLDLSKIEAGGMPWNDELIKLEDVVRDAVRAQHRLLEDRGVVPRFAFAEDLPETLADRDRIHQVVTNLLSNAIKFSPKGEVLDIRVEAFEEKRFKDNPKWLRVGVTDRGPGIAPKDHKVIFDRFSQISSDTLQDKPRGTGLGLAICKDIVTHYGGNIWVESREGAGSTFYFTLPAASRHPAAVPGKNLPEEGPPHTTDPS